MTFFGGVFMVFAIIGGDERQIYLSRILKSKGHTVRMCGFEKYKKHMTCLSVGDALFGCDCIILPIPTTRDGKTVYAPFGNGETLICDIIAAANKKTIFFTAGTKLGMPREYDYFAREELTVQNALITAEGAIAEAISNTNKTLLGSNVLITGFGRISKFICARLAPFGCNITATSRRAETEAWIKSYGYNCIDNTEIERYADLFDIIFNTIPSPVITEQIIKKLKPECTIFELASAPYGVDFNAAQDAKIKTILASGLPAKTAPKSAAEIIYNTIFNILHEKI